MSEKVLDFIGKRNANIEQKRRNFERILFQNFLGAYTVLDDNGTNYKVQLVLVPRRTSATLTVNPYRICCVGKNVASFRVQESSL